MCGVMCRRIYMYVYCLCTQYTYIYSSYSFSKQFSSFPIIISFYNIPTFLSMHMVSWTRYSVSFLLSLSLFFSSFFSVNHRDFCCCWCYCFSSSSSVVIFFVHRLSFPLFFVCEHVSEWERALAHTRTRSYALANYNSIHWFYFLFDVVCFLARADVF